MNNDGNIRIQLLLAGVNDILKGLDSVEERLTRIRNVKINGGVQQELENNTKSLNVFADSYQKTIASITRQAEGLYQQFQQSGDIKLFEQYKSIIPQIQQMTAEQRLFNKAIKDTNNDISILGTSWSKHLGWALTGLGVGSVIGGVVSGIHDLTKLDEEFTQLQTVIPETEHNQQTFNQAIKDSFALSERYGTAIKSVTDSLRLMGRQYHELSESEKLAELALKLSVADNFSPEVATKSIEAVVGSYQKQGEAVTFATHAMDSITKVSHTSQVSALDLALALMRSAAAAHAVGISFDELNALISVTSRNTGLSGEDIGNMWKSVANSIHSSKAIESLKEFGIESYKVGENGQKEFRKVTDVLMDVSIKAKTSNQNIEELFRNLAGGKWQVSKLSAFLGSPDEYIRVLGNSINSSGFTDKQLEVQMSSIKRKAETLKASFEELLMTGGNESGFRNELKNILDTLNQVLKGLNNINPAVWNTIGYITKFAIAFVTLRTAINYAEASYALLRNTIITTTAAQETLNVATMANPWGAVAKLIALAGTALATYCYFAGQAATAQEKANQAADNAISAKASEIEMTKQQTGYMETLGNTYVSLQQALAQVGDDETKATEIKKTMGTVSQQLSQIVGKEAADRILASDDIMGAITQEQQVHNEKTTQMQQELDNLRQTQAKLANDTIAMVNERIGAINAEATAFDKAADAIGQALGRIDEFMFKHLRNKASYLNNLAEGGIKDEWKIAGIQVPEGQDISEVTNQIKAEADQATKEADEIKANALNYLSEKGRVALGKVYTPGNYGTTPITTGEVDDSPKGKKKRGNSGGTGQKYAPDREVQMEKLWTNYDLNHTLANSKVAAEQYQEALAKLQVQQDINGETALLDAQKFALMTNRVKELTTETDNLTKKRDEYQQKANDLIATHSEIADALNEKKLNWNDLTKDEKKDFVHAYLGDTAEQKLAINYLENVDKLTTKIADNNKHSSSISNELQKEQYQAPARLYNKNIQSINLDEQHEELSLGYNASSKEKRLVQLKYAMMELVEAQKRLKEIEDSPTKNVDDLKKQQVEVDKLKNQVDELANYEVDNLKNSFADMVSEWATEGKSFGDIWADVWKEFEQDAIYALLGIKGHQKGFLSQLLDNSSTGDSSGGLIGWIGKLFGHAEGGIFDTEHIARFAEGNKKEAVIPMQDNKERGQQLWLQTGAETGWLNTLRQNQGDYKTNLSSLAESAGIDMKPKEYTYYFKNPELAKSVINVNVEQKNNTELIEANQLMKQQNQMLLQILQNGSNGNSTVVPIVTQVSSDDVLRAIQNNPQAFYSIMNQHKQRGWGR